MNVYTPATHAMESIATAYRQTLRDHGHRTIELEFRLGRRGAGGAFVAGVPKTQFDTLVNVLQRAPAFRESSVTTHERLNGTDSRYITTNGDESTGRWQYKKKVCVAPLDDGLRGAIAIEGSCSDPPPPGSPPFAFFRTKKRTRFQWKCWSVDATRVTSNLPCHADNDEDIYEVEVELVDPDYLFDYTLDHLVHWGATLTKEIQGLLLISQ